MSPRRAGAAAFALLACVGFVALGSWQLERRSWKLDLIARVAQRVHAPAVAAPGPDRWPLISAAEDEYRHVQVTGEFLHDRETLVQATTELGSGSWVLTPLRLADGAVVLVNRGFVSSEQRAQRQRATRAASETRTSSDTTTVTGLLRMNEPAAGLLGLLRRNDAAANRWYARDVRAIAAARGLVRVAPYFIDADADAAPRPASASATAPAGGLTVIAFRNDHLTYALTWYALALMAGGAVWRLMRDPEPGAADLA